jgi:PadR family transcriptional regulator, regulatory protein PadR
MARRKAGTLLPLELRILESGLDMQRGGDPFHGFALAAELARGDDARPLSAHGTLYKALGRLAESGLLVAEWEDPAISEREGRPRRRLYTVTPDGAVALAAARAAAPVTGMAPGSIAARGLA